MISMQKIVFGKDVRLAWGLALIGLLAGIATAAWQLSNPSLFKIALPSNVSKETVIAAAGFQVMIMTFMLSIIGIKLAKKVASSCIRNLASMIHC